MKTREEEGPLKLDFSLPRTVYAPGDEIIINASVDNRSSKDLTRSYARLVARFVYEGYTGRVDNDYKKCHNDDGVWSHEKVGIMEN